MMAEGNVVLSDDFGLKMDPETWLPWYSACGISRMDFLAASPLYSRFDCRDGAARRAALTAWRKRLAGAGLSVFSFTPEQSGYPFNLSDTNAETRRRSLRYYLDSLDDAAALRAEYLSVHPGWYTLEEGWRDAFHCLAEVIPPLAARAEAVGVGLLAGASDDMGTNVVGDCRSAAALFEEAGTGALSLALNAALPETRGERFRWYRNTFGPRLVCLDATLSRTELASAGFRATADTATALGLPLRLHVAFAPATRRAETCEADVETIVTETIKRMEMSDEEE